MSILLTCFRWYTQLHCFRFKYWFTMKITSKRVSAVFITTCIVLSGCQSSSSDRYTQRQDSGPRYLKKQPDTADAVPKYEAYRMFNSRPYKVLGKHYTPLSTGKGFEQTGYASWYGQKFHGHLTSNGETYNMFAMSAAHKTLPLPSYVRVTNLENNKHVIVRVNDRGPFHDNRIIDLSYAASVKLGYHSKGTTKVKIQVIHFDEHNNVTVGNGPTLSYDEYLGITKTTPMDVLSNATSDTAEVENPAQYGSNQPRDTNTSLTVSQDDLTGTVPSSATSTTQFYIQVAALTNADKAKSISNVLSALYQVPAHLPMTDNVYKLQLGPISDETVVTELLEQLKQNGYPNAYAVTQTL